MSKALLLQASAFTATLNREKKYAGRNVCHLVLHTRLSQQRNLNVPTQERHTKLCKVYRPEVSWSEVVFCGTLLEVPVVQLCLGELETNVTFYVCPERCRNIDLIYCKAQSSDEANTELKANLLSLNNILDVIAVIGHHLLLLLRQGLVMTAGDGEQHSVSARCQDVCSDCVVGHLPGKILG